MGLTPENYSKGFLVDEELMGGVTRSPEGSLGFVAYVLRHTTGEYLGYQPFTQLEAALDAINNVQRGWKYEGVGCGGAGGSCAGDRCKISGCGMKKVIAAGSPHEKPAPETSSSGQECCGSSDS